MKLGCVGCLLLSLILAAVLFVGAGAVYFGGAMFDSPAYPPVTSYTAIDGERAQQKLFDLLQRRSGREAVVLTERELNAFLARHLERSEGLPFSPLVVRLLPGMVHVQGRTTLANLFKGFPFWLLAKYLPASTMDRHVWVTVRGTVQVQRGKSRIESDYGQLQMSEFSLGNQDLSPRVLSWMLGWSEHPVRQWPLPPGVEGVTIEQGRMVITTR